MKQPWNYNAEAFCCYDIRNDTFQEELEMIDLTDFHFKLDLARAAMPAWYLLVRVFHLLFTTFSDFDMSVMIRT